ncbi:GAF domain-containing protein [Streptomyces iranensis]|uniref:Integral membrane sensor protein n=1 Tax=Streptomyces iranensis TaxID=576784 RepID=A0A060ZWR8_9ACTN|nr:GAF domain-containing protein [Streptomyces iranensis]MBP2059421.1 transcriptional regulator of acetoin/glycerol metabolism [Streptomyces iranensis]CDR10943.1 integral membrane sensor protein [Streptomyces iranensis]
MDSHRLGPRLLASWQRSRRYGLSPEEMQPVFTGSVDTASLFYECGHEVLRGLRDTLANEAVSMMIADSDGLVLCRVCDDASISRSLDRVHLAPGFSFAERDVGTNGLGLALTDRAPSLVRADEHYYTGLRGYTCAAAPVLDPRTGGLVGSVNLTTWSDSSSKLLLALAQAAAGNTAALMLARGTGRRVPPAPRGEVFRVYADRYHQHDHAHQALSPGWTDAVAAARTASARGRIVAVIGEPGAGKTALVSTARRQTGARERLLSARTPAPGDVAAWLALWAPELGKDSTCVLVSGVDRLPAWAATELARLFDEARRVAGEGSGRLPPFAVTARRYSAIPDVLRPLVDTVVEVPALRFRPDDILPLARHFARWHRGPTVTFTPAAARALTSYDWPENVGQLRRAVREAASRTDVIDTRHLPAEVFTGSSGHLPRLQLLERDEIVRCLTEPGTTVAQAAAKMGMGRATVYRKMARYGIRVPGRRRGAGS